MMSEDEFVVLVEHAGLVDSFDESELEFIERYQLLEWLDREGVELLRRRMIDTHDFGLFQDKLDASMAELMVLHLLEKKWISAVESEQIDEDTYLQFYALRLSTTEAYRIYLEKDTSTVSNSPSTEPLIDVVVTDNTSLSRPSIPKLEEPSDIVNHLMIREQFWNECFPTSSDICRQLYFSFDNPQVILYTTLGLQLIQTGRSSVPAFSRELKILGISHQDRTVIVGFLARAFPT